MTALVIGGNGFIGSHLVDALLLDGQNVKVFDRSPELYRAPLPEVKYYYGDFSGIKDIDDLLDDVDVVYHLVSTTVPSTSNLNPVSDIQGNLINTVQLLELMVRKGIERIVYLSSGGTVYGVPQALPINEDHPLNPICSYGVVKVAIENYLFMFQSLYKLKPLVLRVSNPYGARQGGNSAQGIIGAYCKNIHLGKPIEVWGDGTVQRDYIHISDLVSACVKAGNSNHCGVFNAGRGVGSSILEVIDAIESVVGQDLHPVFKKGRSYDVPKVVLDISKIKTKLGWEPKISLTQGVREAWEWVKCQ